MKYVPSTMLKVTCPLLSALMVGIIGSCTDSSASYITTTAPLIGRLVSLSNIVRVTESDPPSSTFG